MVFVKKNNRSIRLSSKSSPGGGGPKYHPAPPPKKSNPPPIEDERRDDGSASGLWSDMESRVDGSRPPSQASGAPRPPSRASSGRASSASNNEPTEEATAKAGSPAKEQVQRQPSSSSDKFKQRPQRIQREQSRGSRGALPATKEELKRTSSQKKKSAPDPDDKIAEAGRRGQSRKDKAGAKDKKKNKEKMLRTSTKSGASAKTEKTRMASNQTKKMASSKKPSVLGKKKAVEKKAVEKPAVEKPAVEKPAVEKPAVGQRKKLPSQKGKAEGKLNKEWKNKLSYEEDTITDESSCSSGDETYSEDESASYSDTETEESISMGTDASATVTDDDLTDALSEGVDSRTGFASLESTSVPSTCSTNRKSNKLGRGLKSMSKKLNNVMSPVANAEKDAKETTPTTATRGGDVAFAADANSTAIAAASPVNGASVASAVGEDSMQAIIEQGTEENNISTCSSHNTTPTLMTDFTKMEALTAENRDHQLTAQVIEHGGVDKLVMQVSYVPKPRNPSDIVIKVECSTITLQDCMIRRGSWYAMQDLPFVPGSDFVGIIHDMGEEAAKNSTFRKGDKVAAVVPSGGNQKYATVSYKSIMQVPNEVDSIVALCLSSVYVPAREAMDHARKLNMPLTGANVLVVGGNSPSGLATIELALLEGANVFTTADECHHPFLSRMGAKCFPIQPEKWLPKLQGRMDVVMDSVCMDEYVSSTLALSSSGILVCRGMSAVYTQGPIMAYGWDVRDYKAMQCKMKAKYMLKNTVYYDRMERYNLDLNEYAQHFRYLCHLEAKDAITPLVSTRAPLSLVASTHQAIEHASAGYGICICTPWITNAELTQKGVGTA